MVKAKYVYIVLLIALASFCDAVMDQINFRPDEFIWSGAWLTEKSVYEKDWMYPFFFFLSDGWHFFKGGKMAILIGIPSYLATDNLKHRIILFIVASFAWMFVHMVFFKGILNATN